MGAEIFRTGRGCSASGFNLSNVEGNGTLSSTFGRYSMISVTMTLGLPSPTLRTVLWFYCRIVPPIPQGVPAGVATLYEHSFSVKAPKLWNCLPSKVVDKDDTSLSPFKSSLGTFLDKVPDMPPTGQSGVNNNSLFDWAKQNF